MDVLERLWAFLLRLGLGIEVFGCHCERNEAISFLGLEKLA